MFSRDKMGSIKNIYLIRFLVYHLGSEKSLRLSIAAAECMEGSSILSDMWKAAFELHKCKRSMARMLWNHSISYLIIVASDLHRLDYRGIWRKNIAPFPGSRHGLEQGYRYSVCLDGRVHYWLLNKPT